MKKLKNMDMVAVQNATEKTNIIGYLTWYSIAEGNYEREDLRKNIINAGLDERYMPKKIRGSDAFRRATKAIERFKIQIAEGVFENYLIRNVSSSQERTQRNLVREIRDTKGNTLNYDSAVAELVYDRKQEQFIVQKSPLDGGIAEELIEEAQKLYGEYLTHHNANVIRSSILSALKDMAPVPVRPSGGVYFIPAKHEEKLSAMIRFLNSLGRSEGVMIPLIDIKDNRNMVEQKLNEHLRNTFEYCVNLLRNPNTQKVQIKTAIEDAKRIVADFKMYREIVTGGIDDMENKLDLIRQQIQLLLEKEVTK